MNDGVNLQPILGVAIAVAGDDAVQLIERGLRHSAICLQDGDVIVIASKLLSRCEGRSVKLASIEPGDKARSVAEKTGKDPRFVQVVLDQSSRVSRTGDNVMITRHQLGYVSANAAVDASNVLAGGELILLPVDPDASAQAIARQLSERHRAKVAVIVSDSFGRPFRRGTVAVALGSAAIEPIRDRRGDRDLRGRIMEATQTATVDAIAAAADLLMGQGDEAIPAVVVRGLAFEPSSLGARSLCRDPDEDLYL